MKSIITKRMWLLLEEAEQKILDRHAAKNPKFNPQDWLRSAIRLLAAVEAAGLDAETIVKETQKKASK